MTRRSDPPAGDRALEDLLRALAPQVLGALVRRYGRFDVAEDAVQEALLAAARQWPVQGVPERPRAWLVRVAARRLTDLLRAEGARRRREVEFAARAAPGGPGAAGDEAAGDGDDTLVLLVLCCHPALSRASQIALTLRAVGGLGTAEIARALLTSEEAMTRRISRAKRAVADSGVPFRMPPPGERAERLATVLHVLYLIFTEGYAATAGPDLRRVDLTAEAIRLAETVCAVLPEDGEALGLLALMLLTDARSPARVNARGELVPMREQDRSRWKAGSLRRGVALVERAAALGPVGPYQLQAAIAACHAVAPGADGTDWGRIAELYRLLVRVSPGPVTRLNHAVAVAMAEGPRVGLALLDGLGEARLERDHRLHAARAHLLERSGDRAGARESYLLAARYATNLRHVRYLRAQARRLG